MKLFQSVTLICKVDGVPRPNITWFKDDVNTIIPMEITEELRIEEVDVRDRGIFWCAAKNRIEVASGVLELKDALSSPAVLNIEGISLYNVLTTYLSHFVLLAQTLLNTRQSSNHSYKQRTVSAVDEGQSHNFHQMTS